LWKEKRTQGKKKQPPQYKTTKHLNNKKNKKQAFKRTLKKNKKQAFKRTFKKNKKPAFKRAFKLNTMREL